MGTGHGTRSASTGSPQRQKEVCLDLRATFLCFLPSWPTHLDPFLPKHCLPGVLTDGLGSHSKQLAAATAPAPLRSLVCPPHSLPASSPLWVLWDLPTSDRGCPDSQGSHSPGACHLHSNAWWVPGHPRLRLSLLASLLGL